MTDPRPVLMTAEQAADIERYIVERMHAGDSERASRMMLLEKAYKFAKPVEPELPENVYPLVKHAGDNWSRKVPCA